MPRPVVVIAANAAWNLVNFRSNLIRALIADGYDLVGAAPADAAAERALATIGCRFHQVPVDSAGVSPRRDLQTMRCFDRLLRAERARAFLGFTVKPNVYGSLAARRNGVPAINNISGLGTAFIADSWLTPVVSTLYRVGLSRSGTVFFQNADDRDLFLRRRLVRPEATRLLPGSGIDLNRFAPALPRPPDGTVRFLLIARLLRDKGVIEYVEAARRLRAADPSFRFAILGFAGAANMTAIGKDEVERWAAEGAIEYLGSADDVRPHIAAADCVVLPSYREGTSRVLLEAAAMARPLVATDVPGCREVIDEGITGFLCRVRDAGSLADAMGRMAVLDRGQRAAMGAAGRAKMEREFDERIVIDAYRAAISVAA